MQPSRARNQRKACDRSNMDGPWAAQGLICNGDYQEMWFPRYLAASFFAEKPQFTGRIPDL
jgi:hypothetical protein